MFPATFLNFGPACSAIFLLWSFGEINQLELSIYLDIYDLDRAKLTFQGIEISVFDWVRFYSSLSYGHKMQQPCGPKGLKHYQILFGYC